MTLREVIAQGENVALEFKDETEGFAQAPQAGLGVCQRTRVLWRYSQLGVRYEKE